MVVNFFKVLLGWFMGFVGIEDAAVVKVVVLLGVFRRVSHLGSLMDYLLLVSVI